MNTQFKLIHRYSLINLDELISIEFMFDKVNRLNFFSKISSIYLDQNKSTPKLDSIGTYSDAMNNQSLDYLALIISLSSYKFFCHFNSI